MKVDFSAVSVSYAAILAGTILCSLNDEYKKYHQNWKITETDWVTVTETDWVSKIVSNFCQLINQSADKDALFNKKLQI